MDAALKRTIVEIQRDELTEHHVYNRLAGREKDAGNREVLARIAAVVLMLAGALLIILAFSFYISVARGLPFTRRFAEMAGLSLGVAAVGFGIGYLLRLFMGVDV